MRGLFDRLAAGKREVNAVTSIAAHLTQLLNARQGSVLTDPAYGLPDLTDWVREWPQGPRKMEQAIAVVIANYEPRLTQVTVRFVPTEATPLLRFQVAARLASDPRKQVRFHTQLDATGRFELCR